jgi:uncharacterized protein (TIGR03437 family)
MGFSLRAALAVSPLTVLAVQIFAASPCNVVFTPFAASPDPKYALIAGGINDFGQVSGAATPGGKLRWGFVLNGGVFEQFGRTWQNGAENSLGSAGINNAGQVVGNFTVNGLSHGFLRGSDGMFKVIDYPAAQSTTPNGFNNLGDIAGTFIAADGTTHGFLRTANGQFKSIDFPGATQVGLGINDSGEIAGWYRSAFSSRAFTYQDGVITHLFSDVANKYCTDPNSIPGQGHCDNSFAYGINNSGQVVGSVYWDAFQVGPTGSPRVIQAGADGNDNARGAGINDVGDVLIWDDIVFQDAHATQATLLTMGTTVRIDSGQYITRLSSINNGGQIVGQALNGNYGGNSFLTSCQARVPKSISVLSGDGQNAAVQSPLVAPLVATVTGSDGLGVHGVTVNFAVTSGEATLSVASAVTDADGSAATYLTMGSLVGSVTVSATAAGFPPVQFHEMAVLAGHGPTLVITSGQSQTAPPGMPLPQPLVAKVMDGTGAPLSGVPVSFAVQYGSGSLTGVVIKTRADGTAATTLTLGSPAGYLIVDASVAGQSTLVGEWETPTQIKVIGGSGQSGAVLTTLSGPLVVQGTDTAGNPMYYIPISFAVTSGSATLSQSTVETASDGTASVNVTLGSPGPVVITASVSSPTPVGPSATFKLTSTLPPGCTASVPLITSARTAIGFGGAANFSAGSWLEIQGSNLATNSRQWQASDFRDSNAPTSLDGTAVSVNGISAFVYYISPGQVNIEAPADPSVGAVQIVATNCAGPSNALSISKAVLAPGMLAPPSFNVGGKQYLVALFPDGVTYVGNAGLVPGATFRPAKPGETIVTYGIGFGGVTPATGPGLIATAPNQIANPISIEFGQTAATLLYSGLSVGSVGLYQFNMVVPDVPDGDYLINVNVAGMSVAQGMYLTVQR